MLVGLVESPLDPERAVAPLVADGGVLAESELLTEGMKKTAPMVAVGCIIDATQGAKPEVLGKIETKELRN